MATMKAQYEYLMERMRNISDASSTFYDYLAFDVQNRIRDRLARNYDACHGHMKGQRNRSVVLTYNTGDRGQKRESKMYLKWLIKKSPYKSVFYKTTLDTISDYVFTKDNKEFNLTLAALMAYRYSWQQGGFISTWNYLVKEGLTGNEAFLAAHSFYLSGRGLQPQNTSSDDVHWSMAINPGYMTEAAIRCFMEGDVQSGYDSWKKHGTSSSTIRAMWAPRALTAVTIAPAPLYLLAREVSSRSSVPRPFGTMSSEGGAGDVLTQIRSIFHNINSQQNAALAA